MDRFRRYAKEMSLDEAVNRAVNECIKEGILADFLTENKAEVVSMSIFEYDEEKVIAMIRKEEYEDGVEQGIQQGKEIGIRVLILDNLNQGISREQILVKLENLFQLTKEQAKDYWNKYSV